MKELCRTEVVGIMEQKFTQVEGEIEYQLVALHITLAKAYQALPEYGSTDFGASLKNLTCVSLNRWKCS